MILIFFFFFSSRRRHTRSTRDWSSDVCSSDAGYRGRLLANGAAAAAELGYGGWEGEHLRCVENMPAVHNVIVCTLCSCYPWPVLGIPPVWYKSPPYRSRVVREPRAVLAEFGLELPDEVELRVWDSSADMRYI